MDLEGLAFIRTQPAETGRPPYNPSELLKLYIYGYLNRIKTSRRLEHETHRNVEVMWLLRKLHSDFKTIADFRKDNGKAFKKVFREFTVLCRKLDLFGKELVAIDGSKFKAVNSNAGDVYIGASTVTVVDGTTDTTSGYELAAGEETGWLPVNNLNLFYRICDNAGDDLTYLVLEI